MMVSNHELRKLKERLKVVSQAAKYSSAHDEELKRLTTQINEIQHAREKLSSRRRRSSSKAVKEGRLQPFVIPRY